MDIEFKDVKKLMTLFKSFFSAKYHITMEWKPVMTTYNCTEALKRVQVVTVRINDTIKGGEGEENWTLDYAQVLLTQPKEMDKCVKRWLSSFAKAKRKATLDILGHKNVTIPDTTEVIN
jgi:hypothetical protein